MITSKKDFIIIDGVSSDTVGLYIDTVPVPPMAQQRYTEYQAGGDTDGVSPDDTFENIKIPIIAYQLFPENFDNRDVYNFLKSPKMLQTSRFDNYYYKVQKLTVSQPESDHNGQRIKYQITFDCKPFKYSIDNPMLDLGDNHTVVNSGNRYSRPIWTITGQSGETHFGVNGQTLTIFNLHGTLAIDCERMLAYYESEIANASTIGQFPFLNVGENSVYWDNDITRVTVQKNERWY